MDNYFNNISNHNITDRMQYLKQQKAPEKEVEQAPQQAAPQLQPKSGDEILNGLANAGSMNFIVSQIQTKPDFSVGLEERIAGFMNSFEEAITTFLSEMDKELGDIPEYQNMSDEGKMTMAAEIFNQAFMADAAGEI